MKWKLKRNIKRNEYKSYYILEKRINIMDDKNKEILNKFRDTRYAEIKERERKEAADRAEREKREKESKSNSKGGFSR